MGKEDRDRKELTKLTETPEEKQQRRLEKKAKKEAKRKRENEADYMGYTNDSNPFGDSNLTEKFVWKLKNEKEEKEGGGKDAKADARRKEEARRKEIEKVKKRREERELDKAQWEEEKIRLQREQDMQSYQDWEAKEDEFYLKQAKMAAEIRIKQGRAKPIDILYKNLSMNSDSDVDFEMNEPYKIFTGLKLKELEELKNDIRVFLELDKHKEFWQALTIVCDDELETARKRDALDKAKSKADLMRFASNTGMHESVTTDVDDIFKGKGSKELDELHASITQQIESGAAVDVEYWETLLKKLTVFRAKAKLSEIHAELLRKKLAELEALQKSTATTTSTSEKKATEAKEKTEAEKKPADKKESEKEKEKEKVELNTKLYEDEVIYDYYTEPSTNQESLGGTHRRNLLNSEAKKLLMRMDPKERREGKQLTEDEMYKQEAAIAMEEEEEEFVGGVVDYPSSTPTDNKTYSMYDKLRPRKPRFFNRVHTGYEWNKYNQTHYDHDNPPPKVVQGYKFNVFYPDLIEKAQSPTYKILPGPADSPDTCILLIHAGPPYEDIAFKIVNREWEYSHKKGFKCTFERGILHLWFNFKRYRYRR